MGTPTLCQENIKKKVTESPPPPPAHQLFQELRDFEAGGGPGAKPHPPFQKASYGPVSCYLNLILKLPDKKKTRYKYNVFLFVCFTFLNLILNIMSNKI